MWYCTDDWDGAVLYRCLDTEEESEQPEEVDAGMHCPYIYWDDEANQLVSAGAEPEWLPVIGASSASETEKAVSVTDLCSMADLYAKLPDTSASTWISARRKTRNSPKP